MRRSTLFISAILTAFTLAVLVGTASAYREITDLKDPAVAAALEPGLQTVSDQNSPAETVDLTAEEAAALAAKVIGRTDLYSVETSEFEGTPAYLVTFSAGDLVYVGLDGQILSIGEIPVTIISQPSSGGGGGGGGERLRGRGEREEQHEDEHEDEPEVH